MGQEQARHISARERSARSLQERTAALEQRERQIGELERNGREMSETLATMNEAEIETRDQLNAALRDLRKLEDQIQAKDSGLAEM